MADSSKDIQLRELKDVIMDLKNSIKTLQATVDAGNKREEALIQERDNLKEEVELLRFLALPAKNAPLIFRDS